MKLTAGEVYDASIALANIIKRPRQIPQLAKYKIARMHSALEPAYKEIEDRRLAAVQQFGTEVFQDEAKTRSTWQIPEGTEQFKQFIAAWDLIRAEVKEVAISPITLQSLGDSENGVEAGEFKYLGALVVDATELASANGVPVAGNA